MANRTKAELINEIEHLRSENYERSDRLREKSKEIRELRHASGRDVALIEQQANEIKALQAAVKANEQWRRENNSEIKQLRDGATADAFEIRDLRNEIRDLQDVVIALRNDCNNLTAEKHEKANKVKELEQVLKTAVDMRDFWLEEKDSEIKELQAEVKNCNLIIERKRNDYNDLNDRRWGAVERSAEKSKEISKLDKAIAELGHVIGEKDSEIKRLRQHIDDDEITIQNKQNEINNLRCDYDHRQAIITEMSKENKDLQQEVATLRNYSDKQAEVIRHYLSRIADLEQAENPQPFRRVSND